MLIPVNMQGWNPIRMAQESKTITLKHNGTNPPVIPGNSFARR
jgi:hypothetical protein